MSSSAVSQLLEALREAGAKHEVGEYTYCAGCFFFVSICDSETRSMRPGVDDLWCAGRIARAALARYAERQPLPDDGDLRCMILDACSVNVSSSDVTRILDAVDAWLGPREAGPAKAGNGLVVVGVGERMTLAATPEVAAQFNESLEALDARKDNAWDGAGGGHKYDTRGTSDCAFGCGCWAGPFQSGGPDGVDPLGACPKNPARTPTTTGGTR